MQHLEKSTKIDSFHLEFWGTAFKASNNIIYENLCQQTLLQTEQKMKENQYFYVIVMQSKYFDFSTFCGTQSPALTQKNEWTKVYRLSGWAASLTFSLALYSLYYTAFI